MATALTKRLFEVLRVYWLVFLLRIEVWWYYGFRCSVEVWFLWSRLWIFNNNDNCKGISNVEVRWSRFNDNVNCYNNSYDNGNGINGKTL